VEARRDDGRHHQRVRRRARGLPNWRTVRYADDFVVLIDGTQADTGALREEIADVLTRWGCGCHQPRPASCT
jgi:RNA-directed DNA polymerase